MKDTHYPSYDVMREKDHWDDHTQQIVSARLVQEEEFRFFTMKEVELLKRVCTHLTGDSRDDIIQYVISCMDKELAESTGEGQRKAGVPKAQQLIRAGLAGIDEAAKKRHFLPYISITKPEQKQLLTDISQGTADSVANWQTAPQKEVFEKLLTFTTESYYSHPTVWSEIGHGGPAYPRGYVRTQLGQLDPWEAQPEK
jgi:hypothetical protein